MRPPPLHDLLLPPLKHKKNFLCEKNEKLACKSTSHKPLYGPESLLKRKTKNVEALKRGIDDLRFGGGRDPQEAILKGGGGLGTICPNIFKP